MTTDEHPASLHALFDQGEWWRTKDGTWIRVADMARSHRLNTARFLLRRARRYSRALYVEAWRFMPDLGDASDGVFNALCGAPEAEADRRDADPVAWMVQTELYRAIADGLAVDGAIDMDLMARIGNAPLLPEVCALDDCGCSGEAHP